MTSKLTNCFMAKVLNGKRKREFFCQTAESMASAHPRSFSLKYNCRSEKGHGTLEFGCDSIVWCFYFATVMTECNFKILCAQDKIAHLHTQYFALAHPRSLWKPPYSAVQIFFNDGYSHCQKYGRLPNWKACILHVQVEMAFSKIMWKIHDREQ